VLMNNMSWGKKGDLRNFNEDITLIIEAILDGMPGGFFVYKAGGNESLLYINKSILRIFGCDSEEEFRELTGYTFKGMVHPEDYERVEESIEKQIAASVYDLDYVEYRIIQKDGTIRWIEDYGHFLDTEDYGEVFCVFIEDATERMKKRIIDLEKVNDELRNAYAKETQYKKAVLYDAVSFFEVNLSRNRFISEVIQVADRKLYDFFQPMDIKPFQKYSDYIESCSGSIVPESLEEYRRFFNTGRLIDCYKKGELEQTFDSWIIDALGRKRLCHYVLLLGENEATKDVVALFVAKDFTNQMKKQNLLKNALQQAESAKRARSEFLSNISHDICTPLNAIVGYTELMKDHLTETDKIEEYIKKIRMSSEQLLSMVTESLEVIRVESGKASLEEAECRLDELLADVEKTLQAAMKTKSLHFHLDKSGVRHFRVITDYARVREILCQLLDNAIKYTDFGGNIWLTVTEENIRFLGRAKYQFIVEDDGIGISKKFIDSLFDPFKREKNTTKSGVLGVGLGLTVVKNVVDSMEGDISVESEPEKGSKFTLNFLFRFLDRDGQETASFEKKEIRKVSGRKERVLLVEDNEINLEIAKALLNGHGYLIETAQDGSEALKKIEQSVPGYFDLVLMDIQMPVMDGHEATREIRKLENKSLAQIPIIALSANSLEEDYKKSVKAGMNAHFPKPIDMDELQKLIHAVLYS